MPDGLTSLPGAGRDLVVIALPGVQRFISEARSTADARAASEIVARLAGTAAAECQAAGGELVFPSSLAAESGDTAGGGDADSGDAIRDGMPNRVVARAPAGAGAEIAGRAGAAVQAAWDSWVRQAFPPGSVARRPRTGAKGTGDRGAGRRGPGHARVPGGAVGVRARRIGGRICRPMGAGPRCAGRPPPGAGFRGGDLASDGRMLPKSTLARGA